jgi:hypothetical protein
MFYPLDILYIVLSFCALWFTAAVFWLIWQIATMFRNVNDAIAEGRQVMNKVEMALSGIQAKFDSVSSSLGAVVGLAARGVEYVIDQKITKKKSSKK